MTRIIAALIMTLTAASASAATWPWQDPAPKEPPQYCRGFVVGGLASTAASGMSRTDLWLAWNYINSLQDATEQTVEANEYQAGHKQFQNVADAATADSILQKADGDCGLGRSGLEITGW
jgi:hypothetical protein